MSGIEQILAICGRRVPLDSYARFAMTSARQFASCSYCGGATRITERRERLTLYRCSQCSMKGATYESLDHHCDERIDDEALNRPPEELISDRRTDER
jgi:hypothetical protein